MTAIVAGFLVTWAALVGWRLWRLKRELVELHRQVASIPTRVDGELNRMWEDVRALETAQVTAVEARVQRAEAAVAQVAREHGHLSRHVAWMEPWVRHWVLASSE